MPRTNTRTKAAIKTKPPKAFPVVITPHVYDESGLGTCLLCRLKKGENSRLHITPHVYQLNTTSTLKRCICGLNKSHPIHRKVTNEANR